MQLPPPDAAVSTSTPVNTPVKSIKNLKLAVVGNSTAANEAEVQEAPVIPLATSNDNDNDADVGSSTTTAGARSKVKKKAKASKKKSTSPPVRRSRRLGSKVVPSYQENNEPMDTTSAVEMGSEKEPLAELPTKEVDGHDNILDNGISNPQKLPTPGEKDEVMTGSSAADPLITSHPSAPSTLEADAFASSASLPEGPGNQKKQKSVTFAEGSTEIQSSSVGPTPSAEEKSAAECGSTSPTDLEPAKRLTVGRKTPRKEHSKLVHESDVGMPNTADKTSPKPEISKPARRSRASSSSGRTREQRNFNSSVNTSVAAGGGRRRDKNSRAAGGKKNGQLLSDELQYNMDCLVQKDAATGNSRTTDHICTAYCVEPPSF